MILVPNYAPNFVIYWLPILKLIASIPSLITLLLNDCEITSLAKFPKLPNLKTVRISDKQ